MSDTPTNNLEPEALDEELVAYLDGELPPDSAKRVESLLSADNKARDRLGDLAASWDLLDQLPRATVDDLFTRTTVEMVAVAAESEIAAASAPAKRRLQWIGGAVAAVLAAMVGFAAAALALPNQNEALLKDLPVVADLELYRGVSDIAFLKQLQKANLFTEDPPVLPFPLAAGTTSEKSDKSEKPDKEADAPVVIPPIPDSMEAHRLWVAGLPPAEKTELRRNFDWFESHPAEQHELREFDKELRSDPQSAELYKVMQRYHEWLTKTLNPYDRAELALKTSDARVVEIKRRHQQQAARAFTMYAGGGGGGGGPIRGPDQFGVVQQIGAAFRVAQQYALNHEDEILAQLPQEKERLAEIKSEDKERGERRERYPAALAVELWRHNSTVKLPPIKDDELKNLMKTLSNEQAERLKPIVDSPDRMNELRKLVQLGIAANRPGGWGGGRGGGGPASEWLISQYPSEIQKQLKELPPQEREAKLRELRMSQDWPRAGMGPRPGGDGWFDNRPRGQGEGPRRNPDGQPGDRPRGEGGRGEGGRRNQEPSGKESPKDEP